ncbi:COP9 signalosome complex subunit 8 [Fagus crenata]
MTQYTVTLRGERDQRFSIRGWKRQEEEPTVYCRSNLRHVVIRDAMDMRHRPGVAGCVILISNVQNVMAFYLSFGLLAALLILAVVLVIILAVKPKKPSFDLQQVGVQYMGITTPTTSATDPTTSASLSLNIQMLFTAVNPNNNLNHVAFGSGG